MKKRVNISSLYLTPLKDILRGLMKTVIDETHSYKVIVPVR